MAEQLPNLYTFGQVKVDTSSLADLQGKLFAKEQAKVEAVQNWYDKNYSQLSKPTLYENDEDNYRNILSSIKDYWSQNKDKIAKGQKEKTVLNNMFDEALNFSRESKEKKQNLLKITEWGLQGKLTDNDFKVKEAIALPIGDPRRINPVTGRKYSLDDLSSQLPAFDATREKSWLVDVTGGQDPFGKKPFGKPVAKPGAHGETEQAYDVFYTKDQIKNFENNAALALSKNPVAKNYFEQLLKDPNSNVLKEYNDAWSKLHSGELMDTPEKVAQARIIYLYYDKPVKRVYDVNPAKTPTGGGAPRGDGTKPEDFYILRDYDSQMSDVGDGSGRKGILASSIDGTDLKTIKKYVQPAYIKGKQWYISVGPGKWMGDGNITLSDEKLAESEGGRKFKKSGSSGVGKKKSGASGL